MPELQVHQLPSQDIYKDLVRVNEVYRVDKRGATIKEGRVCLVFANSQRCLAVLRGFQDRDSPHIQMDDYTRRKLNLDRNKTYEFQFKPVHFWGQLRWAWSATEMGYQVASRLAVIGFVLGVTGLIVSEAPRLGVHWLYFPWHSPAPGTQQTEPYVGSLIPILSLVVAGLAVFVGPLISLHIGRKQIELSRRIASKQIVAPMRQVWINDLRDKLAELSSSAIHYWRSGFELRKDEEYKRLEMLEEEIKLRINREESDHRELVFAIREMLAALATGTEEDARFIAAHEQTTKLGQTIFKTEWNRIKDDIDKP